MHCGGGIGCAVADEAGVFPSVVKVHAAQLHEGSVEGQATTDHIGVEGGDERGVCDQGPSVPPGDFQVRFAVAHAGKDGRVALHQSQVGSDGNHLCSGVGCRDIQNMMQLLLFVRRVMLDNLHDSLKW